MFYRWTLLLSFCVLTFGEEHLPRTQSDLREVAKAKISDFKLRLHQKLEELTLLRESLTEGRRKLTPVIESRHLEIESAQAVIGCFAQVADSEIVFAVTSSNALSMLRNFTFAPIRLYPRHRPFLSLQAFESGSDVLLIAYHTNEKKRHFIKMYLFNSSNIDPGQKINLNGPSIISSTKVGYRVYTAVASANAVFNGFRLFEWTGAQFDEIFSTRLDKKCSALAIWNIEGTVYVAQSFAEVRRLEVKRFVKHSEEMYTVQFLDVEARVIKYFEDAGSNYLVCGTSDSIILYWWTGSSFYQEQKTLFGKLIKDVSIHTLSGKVIIAVVFNDEVKFLLQSDSARYITAGVVDFRPAKSLKSVLLWKNGRFLHMLSAFEGNRPAYFHEIGLKFEMSDPEREPQLGECIDSVYDHLDKRQRKVDEIASIVEKVWSPSEEFKVPSLEVNGTIRSLEESNIAVLHLETNISSPLTLKTTAENMVKTVEKMRPAFKKTVSKSGEQQIESKLVFKKLTVDNGRMDELKDHVLLNKINTTRLSSVLKKSGHQTFYDHTVISNASCLKAATVFLNGNNMQDYVLLNSGYWNLTGNFVFGNISTRTVFVNNKINEMEIRKFVLTSQEQDIDGLKVFDSLSAETILTNDGVGEVHLDEMNGIVYLDSKNFPSSLNFKSDLNIGGNLNISSFNDYDILQLYSKTVKKYDENPYIYGNKTFKSMIIKGSADIGGKINNCTPDHLMTTTTDQKIYGSVTFSNTTSFQNIITDSLNGVDFSHQAVVKSKDNKIKGVKTFRKNLNVCSILMKEGVLIDNFDPSVELFKIIPKSKTMDVLEDAYWFNNVTVGNIIVTNVEVDANYFPLLTELDNVWLRKTEQYIPLLETTNMTVNNLQVSKVKDISMDDLVRVNGDATINGSVLFLDNISTNTFDLQEGTNLNFSPEVWNPDIKVKILNNITIENAVLEGNLSVHGTFENFETGFMHVKDLQTIKGEIEFEKIEAKKLISKDLNFQRLNKINFTDFFEQAVVPYRNRSISNKHFKTLNGAAMVCEGTLNKVFLDKVVTTNSKQNIASSWIFLKAPSFKKVDVTELFDGMRLEDVVYVDEVGSISNKQFNRNITSAHLNINENINGVNVTDLQLKSFSKSKENTMEEKLIFHRNLTATEIKVLGSKIDGVDLEDIIRLNESAEFESLNASNIVAENITLTGLVNGCHWISVFKNALSLLKDSQSITGRITIRSLVIEGNLMLDYLNGAKIPDWISLMSIRSSSDIEGNLEFENLKVDNVKLLETVNNIGVDFIMNDVVKTNSSQVISSNKTFHEIEVKNVIIDELISNTMCGINTSDIFELSVNKRAENRMLTLTNAVLGGLVSKYVIVNGSLNDLELPTDAVISNNSEVIESEVIINNTVNASAGLSISKINGIHLENFLKNRVTLNTSQALFSALNFTEDAILEGNTTVNGTVNNIRIEEVVKKLGNQTVTSNKHFAAGLEVATDVTVAGSINGVFLDKFLWSFRNESLKDVEFSILNTSSLTSGSINGLSVLDFYDYTHNVVHYINDKLDHFTTDILSFEESLRVHKDAAEHPLSLFNYFELHEVINFGSIQRFLPVYEYGALGEAYELQVTQMVMWTGNSDACRKTKSLIADVTKDGTFNVTKKMQGKIFPFSLIVEKEDVVGFYLQAEHFRRCSPETKTRIAIKTVYSSGLIEKETVVVPPSTSLFDVRLLELHEIFLIVAYNMKGPSARIFIHQYEAINNTWSHHHEFHSQNLTSLDLISVEKDAVSLYDPPSVYLSTTGDQKNPGITIYEWDFKDDEFYLKTNLSTSVSSSALWIYNDGTLYLLLAKEMTEVQRDHMWVKVFTEPLEIYTLEEDLILNHTVNIKGVCSLEMFILAEEVFVLASSNHMGIVYVLQLRGYNGFEVIQEIPAPGVTEARVFTVDSHLYLALNSRTVQSRILKASIRGGRLSLD